MGIPSYFSHIVKNHREILKKLCNLNKNINNLYLEIIMYLFYIYIYIINE